MLIHEQDCERSIVPIRIENFATPDIELSFQRLEVDTTGNGEASTGIRLFEQSAPLSFAEQFPHLLIFAVAASILLAAITAEIDCLRGAGYFWR